MSQFRSEDMTLVELFIQSEASHDTLYALGELGDDQSGCIQFKDLNEDKSAFQRLFVSDVRRCDDMLRIMRSLKEILAKKENKGIASERGEDVLELPSLVELYDTLVDLEKDMKEHGAAEVQLKKQENELVEHDVVMKTGEMWFAGKKNKEMVVPSKDDSGATEMVDVEGRGTKKMMLGHIAGCVPVANIPDMERTLFRATRGNMLLEYKPISEKFYDPVTEAEIEKAVFVVFFSGERSRQKIDKICDSYGASKHSLPENKEERENEMGQVSEKKADLKKVIDKTVEYRIQRLSKVKDCVNNWFDYVMKEKAIFVTLNMFNYDVTHKCLIAEGWCPVSELDNIRGALTKGSKMARASVQTVLQRKKTSETPPTYFRNEPIAKGTQAIVDAYGMARYKEFNPAVFSVVTFPFLFGVMFGDIGHGFIMALAGFLVVYYEKQLDWMGRDEMLGTVYKGRYNIFMMGIFATYAGFIYNELFAVPMELFGSTVWCSGESEDASCLSIPGIDPSHQLQKWMRTNINEAYDFKAKASTGKEVTWNPYPMGSDPGWAHTGNKLNFVNSFKMKFAIIIGVIQMVCGVCTKLMNCLYFQDNITLKWVYIPEMVFINSIFGYLGILIMKKWTTNWDATYVLNHEAVVSIPQVYCQYDAKANKITNLPCWSAPFVPKPEASKMYGGLLDKTVGWCMKDNVLTAGCAVMEHNGTLLVEQNTFGNNTMLDASLFSDKACDMSAQGCMLFKQSPPSLLDSLIKMFMEIGDVPVAGQTVSGQGNLQMFLIFIAFVSVPCLLFPKPYLLKWEHEKNQGGGHHYSAHEDEDEEDDGHGDKHEKPKKEEHGGGGHGHGEFDFGEEMVHQMIHTIEYVLVFWEKTVVDIGLESASPMMLFVTISAWACFTMGVLMGMETLSAFLHALRLHWVEFMNKFYFGDGYKFAPFGFANIDQIIGESAE